MQKTVDLHTHSYYSDGTFSPEGLVILAKQQGLSAIALTDHDTIDGLALFHEAGEKHGIETISGIEFAARYQGFHQPELHIVGLGFAYGHTALTECMAQIQKDRQERNIQMVHRLQGLGLPITFEEVQQCAGGEIITRTHFAAILLQKRLVRDRNEVFQRYLSPGCSGYVARKVLSPKDCIETIHKAGGIAILAHPTLYQLDADQLITVVQDLCGYGLDGIECYYATYTAAQQKQIQKIAHRFGLLPSGGSDFHGENKPHISLGTGTGNLAIAYEVWEALKTRCKKD